VHPVSIIIAPGTERIKDIEWNPEVGYPSDGGRGEGAGFNVALVKALPCDYNRVNPQ
jgi:hypothetical protein